MQAKQSLLSYQFYPNYRLSRTTYTIPSRSRCFRNTFQLVQFLRFFRGFLCKFLSGFLPEDDQCRNSGHGGPQVPETRKFSSKHSVFGSWAFTSDNSGRVYTTMSHIHFEISRPLTLSPCTCTERGPMVPFWALVVPGIWRRTRTRTLKYSHRGCLSVI